MRTLTLHQPWASAMFVPRLGDDSKRMLKEFETRGYAPTAKTLRPGDLLAIHASKADTPELRAWWMANVVGSSAAGAFAAAGIRNWSDLPFGKIIGYGTFVEALRTEQLLTDAAIDAVELSWGNYSRKRYGWRLKDVVALQQPIACRGYQFLFAHPVEIVAPRPTQNAPVCYL